MTQARLFMIFLLPNTPTSCPGAPCFLSDCSEPLEYAVVFLPCVFAWWSLCGMPFLHWACLTMLCSSFQTQLRSKVLGEMSQQESVHAFLLRPGPTCSHLSWGNLHFQYLLLFCDYLSAPMEGLGHFTSFLPHVWHGYGTCQAHGKCNYATNCIMVYHLHEVCSSAAFILRDAPTVEEMEVFQGMDGLRLSICKTSSVLKLS